MTQDLLRRVVAAVREGEDETIRRLLERLAEVADAAALLLLRKLLTEDLEDGQADEGVPALPDDPAPLRLVP
ncbi:hypothetical protein [Streptomyces sp. NPDC052114]|uniref:hypothetical protein n=1 Tax=unclassified Streptomyces TaxID=2593676 RepID=UPI00342E83F6